MRRLLKDQRGQALVEFAITIPVLMLLLSGIIDFGRILYTTMNLNMATQEAVRLGGLGDSDDQIRQFADQYLQVSDPSDITVTISPANRHSGDYVTVTITKPVTFVTPMLSAVLPNPYEASAASTIRVE